MDNPALELLGPTRKALVVAIKANGRATAEDLAEACYLSAAAARMHLAGMERMGLVSHLNKSSGPGRPKNLYFLTQAGENLFPHCEAGLAVDLMSILSQLPGGEDAVETQLAQGLAEDVRGLNPQHRLKSLVYSPRMRKYFPELSEDTDESWEVTMRHCPFLSVARAQPSLCELERRVFARVVGEEVVVSNQENRVAGGERCSFRFAFGK